MRGDEAGSKSVSAFVLVCQAPFYLIISSRRSSLRVRLSVWVRPSASAADHTRARPLRACQRVDRWVGASCLLRDLLSVQAWFSARAQSNHVTAAAWTNHHRLKTCVSLTLLCFFEATPHDSLIISVCCFLLLFFITSPPDRLPSSWASF